MTETLPALRREFATIVLQPQQVLLDKVSSDIADARDMIVDSEFMAAEALNSAGRIATVLDELDKTRLATTLPLREGAQWVNDGFKPALDSLKEAKDAWARKLSAWNKQVAAAKAAAEAEERKRREDEAAKARAAEVKAQREAEELVAQARIAQAAGDDSAAAALVGQAQATADAGRAVAQVAQAVASAPVRATGPAQVKGASTTYKARMTSKESLMKHIVERMAQADFSLLHLFDLNEGNLNTMARLQKQALNLPGVEVYADDGVSIRKRAV